MAKVTPSKTPKKPAKKITKTKVVKQTVPAEKVKSPYRGFVVGTVLAAILLVVANSAIWLNRSVFNTQQFTSISTQALTSESSRKALANEIVDRALQNNPTVAAVVTEPATNIISGLLGSQQAEKAFTKITSKVQTLLTSKRPESITYDLTGIKATVTKLLTVANKDQAVEKVTELPNSITVFDANKVPSFYQYGVAMTFIAPLAFLLALVLLIMPHVKRRLTTEKLLLIQGGILIGAGVMALLIGPIFRPPVLAQVANANMRVVVENFYNAFINSYNAQTMYLVLIGAILVVIPLIQRLYNFIRSTYFNQTIKA